MSYYRDLREYLEALEACGELVRVTMPVNKDTELHPLARLQYRGLPEARRKAFLFENIIDSRGRKYHGSYSLCALAGTRRIYALGMNCAPNEIADRWAQAQACGIEPRIVEDGPVHEEIHVGGGLLEHGGLDEFPIPVSTPGFDSAAYFSAPCWVTRDLDTGVRNVGMYRAQVKAPDRTGVVPSTALQGISRHLEKARLRGQPLQAALVLGATPNIPYVAAAAIPHGMDEFYVAGGLAGEAVPLVKCRIVDLEVPAFAEIVLEGEIASDVLEPEAPFGEAMGMMGVREYAPVFQIKCITHRRKPILQGILSEFPPSEATVLMSIAGGSLIRRYLRDDCGIEGVLEVAQHEQSCASFYTVIQVRRDAEPQGQRVVSALMSQAGRQVAQFGKIYVIVDDDVDPNDADAVNWAISTRCQPHRDVRISAFTAANLLDPSVFPPAGDREPLERTGLPQKSLMSIDATMKWPYPPLSLPRKDLMEEARDLWNRLGLPPLQLRQPWWGHNLGFWTDQDEEEARLAALGEYYVTGAQSLERRRKV